MPMPSYVVFQADMVTYANNSDLPKTAKKITNMNSQERGKRETNILTSWSTASFVSELGYHYNMYHKFKTSKVSILFPHSSQTENIVISCKMIFKLLKIQ